MSTEQRKTSPLSTPEKYCTSLALCSAVNQFYKVPNAAEWYTHNRKRIMDKALPDPFNVSRFETIHDWHGYNAQRLAHTA